MVYRHMKKFKIQAGNFIAFGSDATIAAGNHIISAEEKASKYEKLKNKEKKEKYIAKENENLNAF